MTQTKNWYVLQALYIRAPKRKAAPSMRQDCFEKFSSNAQKIPVSISTTNTSSTTTFKRSYSNHNLVHRVLCLDYNLYKGDLSRVFANFHCNKVLETRPKMPQTPHFIWCLCGFEFSKIFIPWHQCALAFGLEIFSFWPPLIASRGDKLSNPLARSAL